MPGHVIKKFFALLISATFLSCGCSGLPAKETGKDSPKPIPSEYLSQINAQFPDLSGVDPKSTISFKKPGIEAYVRDKIGKKKGDITVRDLHLRL
jgi:hypothetical protein